MAGNEHHLEAVVFSKCVSVLVAHWVFSFPRLTLQPAGFPALWAHPHSACHLGQGGCKQLPGSDPWLAWEIHIDLMERSMCFM